MRKEKGSCLFFYLIESGQPCNISGKYKDLDEFGLTTWVK